MANPASIDLQKKVEQVGINLSKVGITKVPTCQVKAALDISGSMSNSYRNGDVQRAFEQLLGFAFKFDDNGEIDMYTFNEGVQTLPTAKEQGYQRYIAENVRVNGGTKYSPCLAKIVEDSCPGAKKTGLGGFFSKPAAQAPSASMPTVVLFFTDGDNDTYDEAAAEKVIAEASKQNLPIYFHLIGIRNDTSFRQLNYLADKYDNCGFAHIRDIKMSDEEMYKTLITPEFAGFLKKHGAT